MMDASGLGYDDVAAGNPRIIYAAGSTFGPLGDDAPGEWADLSGQSVGGLIGTTGGDSGAPTPVGATIADHIASQNLASGIFAVLFARERSGRGQRVETSLLGGRSGRQPANTPLISYLAAERVGPMAGTR